MAIAMGEPQEIKHDLYISTLNRDWTAVTDIFKKHPELFNTRINKSGDTALHVAATDGVNVALEQLLDVMEERDPEATKMALRARDKHGDTPLHCAATRSSSSLNMFKRILLVDPLLVAERNKEKETPLFLAALRGHKENFLYLHSASTGFFSFLPDKGTPLWRKEGGETILHCTIQREYFDLALYIIHLYGKEKIVSSVDEKGITPLHLLASKPSAFKSGTRLRWWNKVLYHCLIVEPSEKADVENIVSLLVNELYSSRSQSHTLFTSKDELPENYHTCHGFFEFLWSLVQSVTCNSGGGIGIKAEREASTTYKNSYFRLNYATFFEFFKCMFRFILSPGLGLMDVKKIKQKHVWCAQIMNEIFKQDEQFSWADGSDPIIDQPDAEPRSFLDPRMRVVAPSLTKSNGAQQEQQGNPINGAQQEQQGNPINGAQQKQQGNPINEEWMRMILQQASKQDAKPKEEVEKMTVLLVAAKNGVVELVKRILECNPGVIRDRTNEDKNILHVAVENRQPRIFEELKNNDVWGSLVETVDIRRNNVLHFAAKISIDKPWKIPGSALQMQWEVKWYQYVKKHVPQHLIFQTNQDGHTPGSVFNESHLKLIADGSEWLKSTSNSCSVVAALIAGVSFATSSQVPGGNDDKTGKPTLEGQPAFEVFTITSLVSLCFSVTALVMFLAILTSRQQHKDFRRDLPFKLLLGLSSLFVSIASILVSFCAAYFFVLKDRLSTAIYIIYAATCLPASLYAVAQFPLYLDLFKAIITEVPRPRYKDDDI